MNDRILELMKQADYPAPELALRAQKLAELIVRECAEICLEANDHKNILQHFGIEPDVNENLRNRSTYFGGDIE